MTQRIRRYLVRFGVVAIAAAAVLGLLIAQAPVQPTHAGATKLGKPLCSLRATLCTETQDPWTHAGTYTGHDEPSALYYSNGNGSGNSNFYVIRLPTDPPTLPKQDGTGGTFNF